VNVNPVAKWASTTTPHQRTRPSSAAVESHVRPAPAWEPAPSARVRRGTMSTARTASRTSTSGASSRLTRPGCSRTAAGSSATSAARRFRVIRPIRPASRTSIWASSRPGRGPLSVRPSSGTSRGGATGKGHVDDRGESNRDQEQRAKLAIDVSVAKREPAEHADEDESKAEHVVRLWLRNCRLAVEPRDVPPSAGGRSSSSRRRMLSERRGPRLASMHHN
jgi:hypothetical protein